MKIVLNVIISLLLVLGAGCGNNVEEEKQKQSVVHTSQTEPKITIPPTLTLDEFEGMKLFMRHCNKCHPGGEKGSGPSLNDKSLPNFLIHFQVRTGRGDMPKFTDEQISKEQLRQITAFVKMMQLMTNDDHS